MLGVAENVYSISRADSMHLQTHDGAGFPVELFVESFLYFLRVIEEHSGGKTESVQGGECRISIGNKEIAAGTLWK
jgi:hypothetical protein